METKIINNRYELIACTAIATEAGDTEEQSAILCRDMDACLGDAFACTLATRWTNLQTALKTLTIPISATIHSPPSASTVSPSARTASDR